MEEGFKGRRFKRSDKRNIREFKKMKKEYEFELSLLNGDDKNKTDVNMEDSQLPE